MPAIVVLPGTGGTLSEKSRSYKIVGGKSRSSMARRGFRREPGSPARLSKEDFPNTQNLLLLRGTNKGVKLAGSAERSEK